MVVAVLPGSLYIACRNAASASGVGALFAASVARSKLNWGSLSNWDWALVAICFDRVSRLLNRCKKDGKRSKYQTNAINKGNCTMDIFIGVLKDRHISGIYSTKAPKSLSRGMPRLGKNPRELFS